MEINLNDKSVSSNKITTNAMKSIFKASPKKPKSKKEKTPKKPKPVKLPKIKNPNKKKMTTKVKWLVSLSVILLLVGGGFYFGYGRLKSLAAKIGVDITPSSIVEVLTEENFELRKDPSNTFTNILAVGIDTRENELSLQNTDTVMIGSYNHKTNETVMFSIPRDTYVDFSNGTRKFNRINAVYSIAEAREEGSGLESLKQVVEEYLGLEIQYYGMVDYQAFTQTVDILGGVTVDVENSFTDYHYPTGAKTGVVVETIHFDKGIQSMDGETALKYSRSRHSLDNGEGSDFARAKRQQIVVSALKDALLSSETWLNPNKILDLLSTLGDNIKTSEMDLQDIKAGLELADQMRESEVYSFIFDPTIGNGKVIFEDRTTWAIVPKLGAGNYTNTNEITMNILDNPSLYFDNSNIWVYDIGLGYYPTFTRVQELQTDYPYLNIFFGGTLQSTQEGEYIYTSPSSENTASALKEFSTLLKIEESYQTKPEFITGLTKGDITILIGKEVTIIEETPVVIDTPVVE
jgi:LCP family protein required for cell wall assembly